MLRLTSFILLWAMTALAWAAPVADLRIQAGALN